MSQSYEELYQSSLQNLKPIEEEIVDKGFVSPYIQKLISTTRSAKEKTVILEQNKLLKGLNLDEYLEGVIEHMGDADSGIFRDADGNIQEFRFADLNPIDAIDKQKAREASAYKTRLQPKLVSDLTGKPVDQLIEQDYNNVANYQLEQLQGSLTNKDYKFTQYDKDQVYNAPTVANVPFAYKVVGKDDYGRSLIEAVNPTTGRQVSFDMGNNPYLNSSFDLYKSVDSKYNRTRLDKYEAQHSNELQRIMDVFDTDGIVGEAVDIAQSSGFQTASRILQHLPDSIVDSEKWSKIANANTGQALADALSGVKVSTRRDFANKMTEASDEWDKGNYVDAILGYGSQMDRLFAESVTQMGLMAAGGAAVAASGVASGGGAIAALGGAFLGATAAGIDKTLATIEEYKANNDGREMSAGEIAQAFALNTATLIPEQFLMGANFSKFLPKTISSKLTSAYKANGAISSRLGTVATTTLGEAGQEGLEGAVENWLSQDTDTSKSFVNHLFSSDTVKQAVVGGMMGGTLSGIGAGVTAPFAISSDIKQAKNLAEEREQYTTLTNTGSKADPITSDSIKEAVNNLVVEDFNDSSTLLAKVRELNTLATAPDISRDTLDTINAKRVELVKEAILQKKDETNRDSLLKALGKTKEEVFDEQVFFSDMNANKQFIRDGKGLSDEKKLEVKKELFDRAKSLGIIEEDAQKSMDQVTDETRFGWKGYKTYDDQIQTINKILEEGSLSEDERRKLEGNRLGYAYRLTQLYDNQLSKLEQFATNAERISRGAVLFDSKFTYKSGKGEFDLKGEHLANYSYESGYSAYGVVQRINKDLSDMANIIESLPEPVVNSLSKAFKGEKFDTQSSVVESLIQRFKDAATAIRVGVKKGEATTTLNDTQVVNKLTKLEKENISSREKVKLTAEIRNVPTEQLEAISTQLESKPKLQKTLKNIIDVETKTKAETSAIDSRNAANLVEARVNSRSNEFKNQVTDDKINRLTTVKDVDALFDRTGNIIRSINSIKTPSTDELIKFYKEVWGKMTAKRTELIKAIKEDTKAVEPTNDVEEKVLTKDEYVVNSLLDSKTNYSATYVPTGYEGTFDIKKELKVSSNPESSIAKLGVTDETYLNKVLANMEPLFITMQYQPDGTPIRSKLAAFTRSGGKVGGLWKDAPHLRLLFNFVNGSIQFKPNDVVVAAIDLSTKELFSTMDVAKEFKPRTKYQIAGPYGLNEATMSTGEFAQLRDVVDKYGLPESALADRLGKLILNNLGLKANKSERTVGYYERTAMGLGLFALSYAEKLGYITRSIFNPKEFNSETEGTKHVLKYETPHVKFNKNRSGSILSEYLGKKGADGVRTGGLKEQFKLEVKIENKPRTEVSKLPKDMKVQGTNGLIRMPSFVKSVVNKLWNTPYEINTELAEIVLNNRKAILARLGYLDDIENLGLAYDTFIGQEGLNRTLSDEIDRLEAAYTFQKENNNKWYFNWFMSKNIRLFIDSSDINPQSGKKIQRFLILPKDTRKIFIPTNENHIRCMNFAIAQAFDSLGTDKQIQLLGEAISSFSLEQLSKLQHDLINLDEHAFKNEYKELYEYEGKKYGLSGIENFGHCLNVIQHLQKMKEANGKLFKTWLAVENDSTTSGYALRMMQFPEPRVLDSFDEKIGLTRHLRVGNSSELVEMHTKKTREDFLDIYETIAKEAAGHLPIVGKESYSESNRKAEIMAYKRRIADLTKNPSSLVSEKTLLNERSENVKEDAKKFYINTPNYAFNEFIEWFNTNPDYKSNVVIKDTQIVVDKVPVFTIKSTNKRVAVSKVEGTDYSYKQLISFYNAWVQEVNRSIRFNSIPIEQLQKDLTYLEKSNLTNYDVRFYFEVGKEDNSKVSLDYLAELYVIADKALPKPEEDGSVSSALRKLLKSPTMISGFAAGEIAIKRILATEIMFDFVNTYMQIKKLNSLDEYLATVKDSEKAKVTAIYSTMEKINASYKGDLYTALKSKSVTEIWIKSETGKNYTVETLFIELLSPTYGAAAWKALSKSFGVYSKYNDTMSQMFVHMFQLFDIELKKQTKALNSKFPNGVPIVEEDAMLEGLLDLYPAVRLAYSESVDEGMLLMSTQKLRNETSFVASPTNDNGMTIRNTNSANLYEFVGSVKSGAVIPIHAIEAMLMAILLDKYYSSVIPVHDAIVMSALDNKAVTQEYHKTMQLVNKEFNVYEIILKRYVETLENHVKRNNGDKSVYRSKMIKADGKVMTIDKQPVTVSMFLNEVTLLNSTNNKNRKSFYSEPMYVANMDGIEGSGVTMQPNETLSDKAFKEAIQEFGQYSDPKGYRTDNDIRHTLQESKESVEGRVKLFDDLQSLSIDLGNKVENTEHLEYLKDLIRKVNPRYLEDLRVEYSTTQDYNTGMLKGDTITVGFDSKTEIDATTRLSPFSDKSPAEIYAHEVVHAGLRVGLANKNMFKLNKEVNQLMELQRSASKVVTWEDFMPNKYDSNLQSVYETYAKEIWDYIFDNPDKSSLQGLHEFTAYGLTNEKLISKLKQHYVVEKSVNTNQRLVDKLATLAKGILDIVFGREKFSSVFSLSHEILKGNVPLRYKTTLFNELELLTNKLNYAGNKAGNKLFQHPLKGVEILFSLVGRLRAYGNSITSPQIIKLLNLADTLGYSRSWSDNIKGSWFYKTKLLASILALYPFSNSRRQALSIWLQDVCQRSQQGIVQSVIRGVKEPDLQTSRLDTIIALTRTVDQTSNEIRSIVYHELLRNFGVKALKEEETKALTTAALRTDLSSLLTITKEGISNIDYITKLLTSKEFLKEEIHTHKKELGTSKHSVWYKSQALGLALYMVTGVGNGAQNLNATNIAEGRMTGKVIVPTTETISTINKLTTLLALELTDVEDKAILANLNKKGLEHFLITHKNFVQESVEGVVTTDAQGNEVVVNTVDSLHAIKGYTKQLLDTTYDVLVDLVDNKAELAKSGYKLVHYLNDNETTKVYGLALYKRSFASPDRRRGAGFIMTGTNSIGTTLKESAYQDYAGIGANASFSEIKSVHEEYYKEAEKNAAKLILLMQSREMTVKEIQALSNGYTPIASPKGGVADFRITMSHSTKVEHLGAQLDGMTALSKMYATQNTQLNAATRNKVLVQFLKDDADNNMNAISHTDLNGHRYIKMSTKTDSKFLKDAWSFIPEEFRAEIKKGDFYVREDWLQDLFGVPSLSTSDNKFVNTYTKPFVRRSLAVAEYVLKHAAKIEKQNIILRVPTVLLGNIISNLNYSIAMGSNPIKVVKKTVDNARSIRDYMDTKKALNRIKFRKRLGTATQAELKQINWYETKLEHNPVHPLMLKGMYQAIVEDINPEDMESIGKINEVLKKSTLLKRIPAPIKWLTRQLYMAEGTALYDFMFTATQYSDFVSRATEYQLQMEKAPEKYTTSVKDGKKVKVLTEEYLKYEEAVSTDIRNAFISYDKPQSAIEGYLNDIGLLMFTKYAIKIQHMITKGVINNPMGVLMFLMFQGTVINTDDIYEQNVFNKSWSYLVHNPVENIVNAATPMPLQYYFGMRRL